MQAYFCTWIVAVYVQSIIHITIILLYGCMCTVAAVSIFANQPLTNRAGRPFSSIVAETLVVGVVTTILIPFVSVVVRACVWEESYVWHI